MSLGPPIKPAPPPPPPEWKPHTDPRFEVNTRTGALRTRIPPPPPAWHP